MNYTYRIYPDAAQETELLKWLETCRGVYNYALRELKDWLASRKCQIDRCPLFFLKVNPNGTSQTCPACLVTVSQGLDVREHHCPECGYRVHRDHAAAEMVLIRGLDRVSSQGLWRTETACQVGLSGVYDLDKWRGAGMSSCEVGSLPCHL